MSKSILHIQNQLWITELVLLQYGCLLSILLVAFRYFGCDGVILLV